MTGLPVDLNGRWQDINATGGPEIIIAHDLVANMIRATYCEPRQCRDRDGSVLDETQFDFEGTLRADRLEGQINVCNFGQVPIKGWIREQLELTVSCDGQRLDGHFFCRVDRNSVPVAIVRDGSYGTNQIAKQSGGEEFNGRAV